MAEEIVEEKVTEQNMGEKLTEDTVGETEIEDTVPENLGTNFMLEHETVVFLLTTILIYCGWAPLVFQETDQGIPAYTWSFSAAFLVMGIAIWTEFVSAGIRYSYSREWIESKMFDLRLHLITSFGIFIFWGVTEYYYYKDSWGQRK